VRWRVHVALCAAALVTVAAPVTMAEPPIVDAEQLPEGLPGVPRVHIETSDPRVELARSLGARRRRGFGLQTASVCRAPCDIRVDARTGQLVFEVPFYGQSSAFDLRTVTGDVAFRVRPGNDAGRFLSIFTLPPLGAGLIAGGIVFAADSGAGRRATGAGMIAGGAALVGLGVALFFVLDTTFERIPPPRR
jgi:hypothetical protein